MHIRCCWNRLAFVVLLSAAALLPSQTRAADAPHIVFMIGEYEYDTEKTLPKFFEDDLAPLGYRASFVFAPDDGDGRHRFDGIEEKLKDADLLVLSVRRRAPTASQLEAVRAHLTNGKALVGIRTASHAFDSRGTGPAGHVEWPDFDVTVLGAKYSGHYGDVPAEVELIRTDDTRKLLDGVEPWTTTRLYKNELVSPAAMLLMNARQADGVVEPVAWTHRYGEQKAKVFYTSLGTTDDFAAAGFRRLMRNAVQWALTPDAKSE